MAPIKNILSQIVCLLIVITSGMARASLSEPTSPMILGALSAQQKNQLTVQFNQAYALLPPLMKEALKKSPFDHFVIQVIEIDNEIAAELTKNGELRINRRILPNQNLVLRTFIHEMSHVYDLLQLVPPAIVQALTVCEGWGYSSNPPDYCELYKNLETTISTMPGFLDIAGWYQDFDGKGQRIKKTTLGYRTADIYEMTNSKEMFAVNMEYFLTDPEYKCRRPSFHRYLVGHFSYDPFADKICTKNLVYVDPHFHSANKGVQIIDPNKVYALHYLLAGPGSETASSFGHAMIRVIMCSPQRSAVGPECLQDIQYHLVLSFRGFVDTPQVNPLAGLLGDYPSRLFFLPFPQIIDEYNFTQLRNLYSYPLALSKDEISAFLERAVETHWTYKNDYKFLTNNCAIETLNLLKAGLNKARLRNVHIQTPTALLEILQKKKMINQEITFNDLNLAARQGYFFSSDQKNLEKALAVIRQVSGQEYSKSEWFELSPLVRRQLFMNQLPTDSFWQKKWAASYLYLERSIEKQVTQGTYEQVIEAANELDGTVTSSLNQQRIDLVQRILKTFTYDGKITGPASLVPVGYGIPSASELVLLQKKLEIIAAERDQNQSSIEFLIKQLLKNYKENQLPQIQENIKTFSNSLRHDINSK